LTSQPAQASQPQQTSRTTNDGRLHLTSFALNVGQAEAHARGIKRTRYSLEQKEVTDIYMLDGVVFVETISETIILHPCGSGVTAHGAPTKREEPAPKPAFVRSHAAAASHLDGKIPRRTKR
jgi:hypothetical protein